jgi:hypothetical protein
MKKSAFSIFGLTVMLMGLFVFFNYTMAATSKIEDGSTGGGGGTGDTSTLTIYDITKEVGINGAGVHWRTNQPTTTWIAYKKVSDSDWIMMQTGLDTTLVLEHVSGTNELVPGQEYEFYLSGTNASGVTVRSSTMTFTSTASIPDYYIPYINASINGGEESLYSTDTVVAGTNFEFRVAVDNHGNAPSPTTTVALSVDGQLIGSAVMGALDVYGRGRAETRIPWKATAGQHLMKFTVDPQNSVHEYDETNNNWSGTQYVTGSSTQRESDFQIKDLTTVGITFQSAVVKWRTNVDSKGVVYYMPMDSASSTHMSLISTSTANWLKAYDEKVRSNHEVVLRNLVSNKKYRYYVVSAAKDGSEARSEVKDFETRGTGKKSDDTTSDKKPDDKIGPLPKQPLPPTSDEQALRERIKRLELRISELESKLLEREKSLAKPTDKQLTERVKGKLLLQVEDNGEVWYIDPITGKKYYFKDGESAYKALQAFGLGITGEDLAKIPVGTDPKIIDQDTDADGVADSTETALGTDPNNPDTDGDRFKDGEELTNGYSPVGQAKMPVDSQLQARVKGRIVIDVNNKGGAWYINPKDGKRYFLGNGAQAYRIMKYLSVGATNDDLRKIDVGELQTDATQ